MAELTGRHRRHIKGSLLFAGPLIDGPSCPGSRICFFYDFFPWLELFCNISRCAARYAVYAAALLAEHDKCMVFQPEYSDVASLFYLAVKAIIYRTRVIASQSFLQLLGIGFVPKPAVSRGLHSQEECKNNKFFFKYHMIYNNNNPVIYIVRKSAFLNINPGYMHFLMHHMFEGPATLLMRRYGLDLPQQASSNIFC